MSKKLIVLSLFCVVTFFPARAQPWLWAKSVTQNNSLGAVGASIDLDPSGNIFIAGRYVSDSMTFGNVTITNNGPGDVDAYIAKYDHFGNALWAKTIGGSESEEATQVATDLFGNVYVAGYFSSSIIIGTDTLINSSGLFDIYLMKFDAAGNELWAKSAGGVRFEYGSGVAIDATGNAYFTGTFCSDSITFGTTTLFNTSVGGYADAFITKYDPNGNVIWAKKAGGTGNEQSYSITVAQSGELFVTGSYNSPVMNFNTTTITNAGSLNIFLAKYDSSGNVLWAKSAGGAFADAGFCVSSDIYGNAYITGTFSSPVCTFGNITLNCTGWDDFFLVKYDSNGNALWGKSAGAGNAMDIGNFVTTDQWGNIYVIGSFFSSQVILDSDTLLATGFAPMFIARYDQNGNLFCSSALACGGNAYFVHMNYHMPGSGIAIDASGNAYITGSFGENPFVVGSDTLSLSGQFDVFIAEYNCTNNPKGIAEPNANEKITVFPNPGNGIFQVIIAGSHNEQDRIEVYDVYGKLILVNGIQENKAEVDILSYPPGLYFIRFVSMDKSFTTKIIKQ